MHSTLHSKRLLWYCEWVSHIMNVNPKLMCAIQTICIASPVCQNDRNIIAIFRVHRIAFRVHNTPIIRPIRTSNRKEKKIVLLIRMAWRCVQFIYSNSKLQSHMHMVGMYVFLCIHGTFDHLTLSYKNLHFKVFLRLSRCFTRASNLLSLILTSEVFSLLHNYGEKMIMVVFAASMCKWV